MFENGGRDSGGYLIYRCNVRTLLPQLPSRISTSLAEWRSGCLSLDGLSRENEHSYFPVNATSLRRTLDPA